MQGLSQVLDCNGFGFVHVRNRASELEHAMKAARSQLHPIHGRPHEILRLRLERAEFTHVTGPYLGVGLEGELGKPFPLHLTRADNALAHVCRRFAASIFGQLFILNTRYFNMNVYAVEERAGEFSLIARDDSGIARARCAPDRRTSRTGRGSLHR